VSPFTLLVLSVAVLAVGAVLTVRRLRDRAFFDVIEVVGRENVVLIESAAGIVRGERRGARPVLDSGCLCLTRSALVFQPWLSRPRLEIPLSNVREVVGSDEEAAPSDRRALRVRLVEPRGDTAALTFALLDRAPWLAALSAGADPESPDA
jgi:hypothetical protein